MAYSTIRYTEPKQSTYESIELHYRENGQERTKCFDSGNIIIDFYSYMMFLQNVPDAFYDENYGITESSTWDHFFMDGNKYHESYFDPETGEFINWRKALDERDYDTYNKICHNMYPNVIHLACHKSFNAVKAYYKKKTKNKFVVSDENT